MTAATPSLMARPRSTIAQFVIWKPKDGQEQKFEAGYKQHLQWHKANGDTWGWYGWYFTSGPRDGQFMDATVGRAWSDFDKPLKPAEDAADGRINVSAFGDFQSIRKVASLDELSIGGPLGLTSKYVRLVTLSVRNTPHAMRVLGKLKRDYQNHLGIRSLLAYRVVDGGSLNDILLFIGSNSFEEYGKSEHIAADIQAIEHEWRIEAFRAMTSETLGYRADMSLFPN